MDSFLAYTGCKTIMKITVMVYPRELEDMTFEVNIPSHKKEFETKEEISHCEEDEIPVKIQEQNETVLQYIYRLKQVSRFCEFEKLGTKEMTIEEELLQVRLIEGL